MRTAIIAYDGCMPSGVHGVADVLAVANATAGEELFGVRILSEGGGDVAGFDGRTVAVQGALFEERGARLVFVPPSFIEVDDLLRGTGAVSRWVAGRIRDGAVVCAACAGVFVLAATGALDGRRATTHWALAGEFRRRFPAVNLDERLLLVDEGQLVCAGGVSAYLDLALHAVSRFGSADLAAACARTLLVDPGRVLQTPYMARSLPTDHGDEAVMRAQELIERDYDRPLSLGDLAREAGLGERTLLRRFRAATGRSPMRALQERRIERAKRLLETTARSVDEIMAEVGYEDKASFGRLFRERTGLTPGRYRARFAAPEPGVGASA